jgi:hypothetical protein
MFSFDTMYRSLSIGLLLAIRIEGPKGHGLVLRVEGGLRVEG